jgi:pimeloyl-ACP methyl ester carboxylesterase
MLTVLILGFTLIGLLLLRGFVHWLILRGLRAPRLPHQRTPADLGFTALELRLPSVGGKNLFAWFIPAAMESPAPTVVVLHGWGANASMMLPCLPPLHAAGFSVLILDARCHGKSDGAPFTSLPRFAEDIEAGLDWLQQRADVDSGRLVLMGHSVGAGAALLSAARRPDVRAVVSLSAFAHPREVMRTFLAQAHIPYPVLGWYVMRHVQSVIGARFDDIAPLTSMTRLRCPVLLVHGKSDTVVPYLDAQRLKACSYGNSTELLLVDGDHDLSDALNEHLPALTGFLSAALSETRSNASVFSLEK